MTDQLRNTIKAVGIIILSAVLICGLVTLINSF